MTHVTIDILSSANMITGLDHAPRNTSLYVSFTAGITDRYRLLDDHSRYLIAGRLLRQSRLNEFLQDVRAFLRVPGNAQYAREIANYLSGKSATLPPGLVWPKIANREDLLNSAEISVLRGLLKCGPSELQCKTVEKLFALIEFVTSPGGTTVLPPSHTLAGIHYRFANALNTGCMLSIPIRFIEQSSEADGGVSVNTAEAILHELEKVTPSSAKIAVRLLKKYRESLSDCLTQIESTECFSAFRHKNSRKILGKLDDLIQAQAVAKEFTAEPTPCNNRLLVSMLRTGRILQYMEHFPELNDEVGAEARSVTLISPQADIMTYGEGRMWRVLGVVLDEKKVHVQYADLGAMGTGAIVPKLTRKPDTKYVDKVSRGKWTDYSKWDIGQAIDGKYPNKTFVKDSRNALDSFERAVIRAYRSEPADRETKNEINVYRAKSKIVALDANEALVQSTSPSSPVMGIVVCVSTLRQNLAIGALDFAELRSTMQSLMQHESSPSLYLYDRESSSARILLLGNREAQLLTEDSMVFERNVRCILAEGQLKIA